MPYCSKAAAVGGQGQRPGPQCRGQPARDRTAVLEPEIQTRLLERRFENHPEHGRRLWGRIRVGRAFRGVRRTQPERKGNGRDGAEPLRHDGESPRSRSETGRAGGRAGDPRGRRRGQSGHDPQPAQTTGRTPYARQAGQTRTVRPSGPPGSRRSRKPPSLKAPPPDSPARRTGKGRLIRARETLRQINCCIFAAGGCRAERTFSPRALRRRHLRFR